jgi:hypothetical protein
MEVRKSEATQELGLFATKDYEKNTIVHVLKGKIFDAPTRETIHVGNNIHVYDDFGIFINHSFDPNIEICKYNLVALKDIKENDELMFNYNSTEINMASPFYVDNVLVSGKK